MSIKAEKRSWERVVAPSDRGLRLDRFWARELADEGVSRGRAKEWIEAGLALVDGEAVIRGKHVLSGGETLRLGDGGPPAADAEARAVPGEVAVVFEDEHLAVVDKRAGLTTHPAPGEPGPTLVNHLLHRWPDMAAGLSGMDRQRPGIVHRLDKDTSGLIAVARSEAVRLRLAADFALRRVCKTYLAIVHGRPDPARGTVDAPIGRHPTHKTRMAVTPRGGREARSDYRVLWTGPRGLASLVAVRIHTGRTHQIRVHMAHLGHPLLGDAVYGPRENAQWTRRPDILAGLAPRQMLHAFHLGLRHPATGEPLILWREPPEDFRSLLAALPRECLRVGIVGMPGSGKSALLGFLCRQGHACFSADEAVGWLYEPGGDGATMLGQRYGSAYLRGDGGVDRPALLAAMRNSEGLRREVMDMIHPMVRHRCEEFFRAHRDASVVYAEVPLLLEGGWHTDGVVDMVAGVRCPEALRTGALRLARGLDAETLAVFDSWQWPEADKLAVCDVILDNDDGLDRLEAEAARLHGAALARYEERTAATRSWLVGLWPELAANMDREAAGELALMAEREEADETQDEAWTSDPDEADDQ
ncbi:dephospho-CoA kinase [Pseudodesulfovibrio sp. F-1]|uniref:Dephospho-CoA kinase n=1 Tax=Pseudodesulfovibrio alkaliphilus TaxID=2661613 RepID=A0A7K1KJL6_9BACT|nr:dephospho-CoA kinase [Pseudodesulfovibrio alkaliphilus]MUM76268.1 dephospho-CoA kinase [Pseudodesulfovibrio alkaliphilus]